MPQGPEEENTQEPQIVQGFDNYDLNNVLLDSDFALGFYNPLQDIPSNDHFEPFEGFEPLEELKTD